MILKGTSRPNRPIINAKPSAQEVDWGGKRDLAGAELWMFDTDVAKNWIFNRIELPAGRKMQKMRNGRGRGLTQGHLREKRGA